MGGQCWPERCPVCKGDLSSRGEARRRVPSLGGKLRRVHKRCAELIDGQITLADPDGQPLGKRRAA